MFEQQIHDDQVWERNLPPQSDVCKFLPRKMEKPMLEKLPSEKGNPSGHATVELPEQLKIVKCESAEELKKQFKQEETWKLP